MKNRGKLLTAIIILYGFASAYGLIQTISNPSDTFPQSTLPLSINLISYLTGTIIGFIALAGIWHLKKWGVYLFFAPFIWILPIFFIGLNPIWKSLPYFLLYLISIVIAFLPMGIALSRNWKKFK